MVLIRTEGRETVAEKSDKAAKKSARTQHVYPVQNVLAEVSEETGVRREDVKAVMESLRNIIARTLAQDYIFRFLDVFNLRLVPAPERKARNPKANEAITVPAGKRVKFMRGKLLTDIVRASRGQGPSRKSHVPEAEAPPVEPRKEPPATQTSAAAKATQAELSKILEGEA